MATIAMAMNAAVAIDGYVLDTLMRDLVGHDRRVGAYLVYLTVIAQGPGARVARSHGQLAEQTGLSKRAVQDAIRHLESRGLLQIDRRARTEAAMLTALTPWRR
jgi:hypothetical protein